MVAKSSLRILQLGGAPDSPRGCRRHRFQEYSLWQNSGTSVQIRMGTRAVHA